MQLQGGVVGGGDRQLASNMALVLHLSIGSVLFGVNSSCIFKGLQVSSIAMTDGGSQSVRRS